MEQELEVDELTADQLITLAQVMLHSKVMNADTLLQAAVGAFFNPLQSPMLAFMNRASSIIPKEIAYVLPQYIAPYVENPCGDAVYASFD